MGFLELFEIGFFTALWNWSNPFLTVLVYIFIAIGALIQYALFRKCRKPAMRWSLIWYLWDRYSVQRMCLADDYRLGPACY